jgi:hypothetical protein
MRIYMSLRTKSMSSPRHTNNNVRRIVSSMKFLNEKLSNLNVSYLLHPFSVIQNAHWNTYLYTKYLTMKDSSVFIYSKWLIPLYKVFLEKLIVTHLVKELSAFMEPKDSLLCSLDRILSHLNPVHAFTLYFLLAMARAQRSRELPSWHE